MASENLDNGFACEVSLVSPNAALTLTTEGTGDSRLIKIAVGQSGRYLVKIKIIRDINNPWTDAEPPPSGTLQTSYEIVTEADGSYYLQIDEVGAATFYVSAAVIGVVSTSSAITFS